MPDAYQLRLQALAKVRRLLSWADSIDNEHEAKQARAKAAELAKAHDIDLADIKPAPRSVAPPPEMMKGFVGAISRAYPGIDTEDYSEYGKKKPPGESKKPYYGDLEDEEIPE